VPTKETQLSTRTAPPPRTDAIRFLIRSLRSIRISKSVYALNRAARAQNGNRRSGCSNKLEIRMERMERIERRRQTSAAPNSLPGAERLPRIGSIRRSLV
jgi:hypothetical protein